MDQILKDILGPSGLQSIPYYDTIIGLWDLFFFLMVVADLLLIVAFLYGLRKAWQYRPELEITLPAGTVPAQGFTLRTSVNKERWKAVVKKSQAEGADALRIAVIDADALVNDVLRQMGLEGKHMADRLSQLDPEDISSLQRVWRAHRVRNDLVHTPGYFLSEQEARKALEDFELFLREVQAI